MKTQGLFDLEVKLNVGEIPYAPISADLSQIPVNDPLDLYLGEVSYVDLLTADEEIQLAKEIEAGKAHHEMRLAPQGAATPSSDRELA